MVNKSSCQRSEVSSRPLQDAAQGQQVGNIMVTKGEMIKLIDFGFATIVRTTGAHTKGGTNNYSSIEKARGLKYGRPDDM